jgi:CYTH domain-containing protein
VKFKDRVIFKHYIKQKIETFQQQNLQTVRLTGYIYDVDVYLGKDSGCTTPDSQRYKSDKDMDDFSPDEFHDLTQKKN